MLPDFAEITILPRMKTTLLLAAVSAVLVAGCKTQAPSAPMPPQAPPPTAIQPSSTNEPADSSPPFVVHAPDGSAEISIDTSKAPDMKDWAEHKLAPV